MSYILCLGFKSIIYKELPTVRLSINQHFIDEFSVDSNNKNTDIKNIWVYNDDFDNFKKSCYLENIYSWYEKNIKFNDVFSRDISFRFFEINESIILDKDKNNICIEVFNNDNNHTNGFMTNSTLLLIPIIYMIPKSFLKDYEKNIKEFLYDQQKLRNSQDKINEIKNYYKNKNLHFFALHGKSAQKKIKKEYNMTNEDFNSFEWIGGNALINLFFDCELLTYSDTKNFSFSSDLFYGIANKYLEYENHGNYN